MRVGPVEPPASTDHSASWDVGSRRVVDDADAHAGVAHRLQSRLDRQLSLLDRMHGDPLQSEPAQLPELLELARRMRRDSESLLLLAGRDPGVRADRVGPDGPHGLVQVLDDAAAVAEETRRIDVRPAPSAAVVPGAATELLHVVAELLDHTTAVYPGARVEVTSRIEGSGAVAVEVRADGASRYDPDGLGGQRALDAAERLAARSRHGITLQRELGGEGLVASVRCPRSAVIVEELLRPVPASRPSPAPAPAPPPAATPVPALPAPTNGTGSDAFPYESLPARPPTIDVASGPAAELDVASTPDPGFGSGGLEPFEPAPPQVQVNGATSHVNGGVARVDELFGPITDIPFDPEDAGGFTPIFEAIASAWFRDEPDGSDAAERAAGAESTDGQDPHDWESPGDVEWRAAAERASRSEPAPLTPHGLPRRRPGNQLVPPPRLREAKAEQPAERVPDRIRDRLSGYQRGLQQGRHRAESTSAQNDPGDPEFW